MPMREAVEIVAVACIKRYCRENPKHRLTARQKHQAKLDLKFRIEDLARRYGVVPQQVDYERIGVGRHIGGAVNVVRRRRGERRALSV